MSITVIQCTGKLDNIHDTGFYKNDFSLTYHYIILLTLWNIRHFNMAALDLNWVRTPLLPHQEDFREWSKSRTRGLIGMEMGTGKTLAYLTLCQPGTTTLIVCPKSVMSQAKLEFGKHVRKRRFTDVIDYVGTIKQRELIDLSRGSVIFTTYPTLVAEYRRHIKRIPSDIFSMPFDRIILDEAHLIKTCSTVTHKACVAIQAVSRWCFTGTPLTNKVAELNSYNNFMRMDTIKTKYDIVIRWKESHFFYVPKSVCNLEDKIITDHVDPPTFEQYSVYLNCKKAASAFFTKHYSNTKMTMQILCRITRLKQISNHHMAMMSQSVIQDALDGSKKGSIPTSAKFERIHTILQCTDVCEKVVIFSQYTTTLYLLKLFLLERGYTNLNILQGQLTPCEREQMIRNFKRQSAKKFRIILVSIKSGGVGIELTAANNVILIDHWWNKAIEDQAVDRVHRMGQTRRVRVHRLITDHTIDKWILALQTNKLEDIDRDFRGINPTKYTSSIVHSLYVNHINYDPTVDDRILLDIETEDKEHDKLPGRPEPKTIMKCAFKCPAGYVAHDMTCPICTVEVDEPGPGHGHDPIPYCPDCKHPYHLYCALSWVNYRKAESTCPTCKSVVWGKGIIRDKVKRSRGLSLW